MDSDLFPGAPLLSTFGLDSRAATLCVVVHDKTDGNYYGLTTFDLFIASQPITSAGLKRRRLGSRNLKHFAKKSEPPRQIMDMVGFIRISSDISPSNINPFLNIKVTNTIPISSAIDKELIVVNKNMQIPVSIIAYDVNFIFEDHWGDNHVVDGGIEINTQNDDYFFDGFSGSPVVTRAGELLGMIVAIDDTAAIVAGLHEPFKNFELEVYVAADAHQIPHSISSPLDEIVNSSVRIAGVQIPFEKRVVKALTYVQGIGDSTAKKICAAVGIPEYKRTNHLTRREVNMINEYISAKEINVESDLRRMVAANIQRLKDINCYRGQRHKANLPTRGQRTHTNARTRKGKSFPIASRKK